MWHFSFEKKDNVQCALSDKIVKLSKFCDTISRKIEKKSQHFKSGTFFADLKASCHMSVGGMGEV